MQNVTHITFYQSTNILLMATLNTPKVIKGWQAADFDLVSVNGHHYNLAKVRDDKGLVVSFICNHCPYVKSVIKKIVQDANDLKKLGIGFVAINSNDPINYPCDSYDNMKVFAKRNNLTFPYLFDESQEIAKKYNAVCTPDFFGFDKKLKLHYRGRLGTTQKDDVSNIQRELFIAMSKVAKNGKYDLKQMPSIGCSIKWK